MKSFNITTESCSKAIEKIDYLQYHNKKKKPLWQEAVRFYRSQLQEFVISNEDGYKEDDPFILEVIENAKRKFDTNYTFNGSPDGYFYDNLSKSFYRNSSNLIITDDSHLYWSLLGLNLFNFDLGEYIDFFEYQYGLTSDAYKFFSKLEAVILENKFDILPINAWPHVEKWVIEKRSIVKKQPTLTPKVHWQKSVSLFVYAMMKAKDKGFIVANQRQVSEVIAVIAGFAPKGISNEVSALFNDTSSKQYSNEDYSKVKDMLVAMANAVEELRKSNKH